MIKTIESFCVGTLLVLWLISTLVLLFLILCGCQRTSEVTFEYYDVTENNKEFSVKPAVAPDGSITPGYGPVLRKTVNSKAGVPDPSSNKSFTVSGASL